MQRNEEQRHKTKQREKENVEFQVQEINEVPPQQMHKFNVQKMEDRVPPQQMHKFNVQKMEDGVPQQQMHKFNSQKFQTKQTGKVVMEEEEEGR